MNNTTVHERKVRLARAINAILAGLNETQVAEAITNVQIMSFEQLGLGGIAYDWWRETYPTDVFADPSSVLSISTERIAAKTVAYQYLDNLKKFIADELSPTPTQKEYESTYVGVLGQPHVAIAKVISKKLVNGLYGQSTLLTFRDKYNNVIKTFAKPAYAEKVALCVTYVLEGTVSKHHIFAGVKETILRHALVDTDIKVKQDNMSSVSTL